MATDIKEIKKLLKEMQPQHTPEQIKEEQEKAAKAIKIAKCQMLIKSPFYGALCIRIPIEENFRIETMATNGKKIYYNPFFTNQLTRGEVIWVIIHELMHMILMHTDRLGDKQPKRWNYATDYAIHCIMTEYSSRNSSNYARRSGEEDFMVMPKGGLYNSGYNGFAADKIYTLLEEKNDNEDDNGSGDVLDDHDLWEELTQEEKENLKAAVSQAAMNSKMSGKEELPDSMARAIGNITSPKKNWKQLLNELIVPAPNDYGFCPPDNRFSDIIAYYDEYGMPVEVILPSYEDSDGEEIKKVLFFADTSGSVSDADMQIVYSEIIGCVNQFTSFEGFLGFFDHKVYDPLPFSDIDELKKIRPKGGGGTDFFKPFEYISENKMEDQVTFIVIITDGESTFPEEKIAKGIPVLWLMTTDIEAPWGRYATLN